MPRRWLAVLIAVVGTFAGCGNGCRSREMEANSVSSPSRPTARAALPKERLEQAERLMASFAERTGLVSEVPQTRYLWTDAFAVRNYLGLARSTKNRKYEALALRLVERVHQTLGKHRSDDSRKGWLSGLDPAAGTAHPTQAGLRIGKKLTERAPRQPLDPELEWDRDGQYFHYLTQWMQALDQVARVTRQPDYARFSRELAAAAHRGFTYTVNGKRRMYWKMSIDLSRALVASMGQHDALDGYVTCLELEATRASVPGAPADPTLADALRDFESMIDEDAFFTNDPLGLGGLLLDAYRLDGLRAHGARVGLRERLLRAALAGVEDYADERELDLPAARRLAFRELGLAIGLEGVRTMRETTNGSEQGAERRRLLDALFRYDALRARILSFWLEPEHQSAASFTEHRDINEVMLATALAPGGVLGT